MCGTNALRTNIKAKIISKNNPHGTSKLNDWIISR